MLRFLYVIRDLVGNNNNSIANCMFYLTKKSNQPEDGSYLEPKHVVEQSNIRNTLISFSSLSYDRSKASSKASCPHSVI